MKRGAAVLLGTLAAVFVGAVPASGDTYPAEHTRAVAYWYLPTDDGSVYRLYRVEVVRIEHLATGRVSARATVVTANCTRKTMRGGQTALDCADGRRTRATRSVDLLVAPDFSSAVARLWLGGRRNFVRFEGIDQPGAFERDEPCSAERSYVAGAFANAEHVHGRLLGRRLEGPYTPDLDHSWVERGLGTWCDAPG